MSGYGLGKNSPVVLSQSRSNFEALIERHGQWLRWRVVKKCPCVTENNRPDPRCRRCKGYGDMYEYQREYEDVFRATVRGGILEIPEENAEALEVYNAYGISFEFCQHDNFLQIKNEKVRDNELVDVRIRVPLVKKLENVTLEKAGGGYYRVRGLLTSPSKFAGVFYKAPGDVLSATKVEDDQGNTLKVLEYRLDTILVDSDSDFLTAKEVEYIMPFRFFISSQEFSKADLDIIHAHNGDAVCAFPYMYNVAEDDVLTVLSGALTQKIVLQKRGDGEDTLPEYFVTQVDSIETKTSAYKEGVDFILVGTNRIHWLVTPPEDSEAMSVTYRYHPTYRVVKNIPALRTSEDQRLPRKVALKLDAAFSEARGVQRNV